MSFQEFWPAYLQAHRLRGTRALHYFATAMGIVLGVEALLSRQVMVFVVGVAACYCVAVASHWFLERNQPLILLNPFWGAIADLKLSWLAMTGALHREYAAHGMRLALASSEKSSPEWLAVQRLQLPGRYVLGGFRAYSMRVVLILASAGGAIAGLMDLHDLFEPGHQLYLPLVQLGIPILAFSAALIAALFALVTAKQDRIGLALVAAQGATSINGAPTVVEIAQGATFSADESSLRRASLALFAIGLTSFVLAEVAESASPEPAFFWIWSVVLVAISCALLSVVLPLLRDLRNEVTYAGVADERVATRGILVDRRADYVDVLESALTLGRRKEVLAATLRATELVPGEFFLDVGCGTGDLTIEAADIVGNHAFGIDATPVMIAIARQKARKRQSLARYFTGVAEALPFDDESLSAVTSTFFFHHLPSDAKRLALREMWRVLAPEGCIVIADYGWAQSLLGLVASLPMRFNYHEYVRGQLNGELEQLIVELGYGPIEITDSFLGYIRVLRLTKH